jgi:hypothetical protein
MADRQLFNFLGVYFATAPFSSSGHGFGRFNLWVSNS